jgi:isopenicillin-N epimerase
MRRFWTLEAGMHFLNHGSFGATPAFVQAAQRDWQARMESQPVRFMTVELPAALRAAADALAAFVGTSGERVALVDNATSGIHAVLHSLGWEQGDELVIANHAYPAVRQLVDVVATRHGLRVVEASIPFPLSRREEIADAYLAVLSARTRLVLVDHVFSPLALVTPLAQVIDQCKARGVRVLVDGAHAPGMLPLALDPLGADWYVGNCHKWMFAAKGCGFVHASPQATAELHPVLASLNRGMGFPREFDWQGTRDYSAWLSLPAALDFLQALGVEHYRSYLYRLASAASASLCEAWGVALPAPQESFAAMVTLPFPAESGGAASVDEARYWHDRLWREHRIEVPVLAFNGRLWVRLSAQVYNELGDYQALSGILPPVRRSPGQRHG